MSYLVQLETNQPSHQGCSSRDCGDDLASNLFGGVAISSSDTVVHRSEVGCGGDEINVVVGIIVFLELDGL